MTHHQATAAGPQAPSGKPAGNRRRYWRSLDEVAQTPEFEQFLHREFPEQADEPIGFDRRRWLQLMGASLALAGVTGCRWEAEQLMPMAVRSAGRLPGIPQKFATCWELDGVGRSLLVTCVDGRPIKVEGNPDHPTTGGGASDAFSQALTLSLYDPDRLGGVLNGAGERARESDLDSAVAALSAAVRKNPAGTRVLCGVTNSPTMKRLRDAVVGAGAKWAEYSPLASDSLREGTRRAFGRPLRQVVNLEEPDVVLCLDADPLGADANALSNLKGWSKRRRPEDGPMNRLYAVESQFSSTGAAADHRLPLKSTLVPAFLAKLEAALDGDETEVAADPLLAALADDLADGSKKKLVLCGSRQPAAVQARVHALNERLGAAGLSFLEDGDPDRPDGTKAIRELSREMAAGQVETLLILGGNPVYDAPADAKFAAALTKVKVACHVSEYRDETSLLCGWHVPAAHPLESWGDARLADGTVALAQPLIAPLHGGLTHAEVLSRAFGLGAADAYEIVRETFESVVGGGTEAFKKAVHLGFAEGTAAEPVTAQARPPQADGSAVAPAADGYELVLCPSSSVHDGRFANLGWLQEAPDFLTKLVWDNAALISPEDARDLGVGQGDAVTLTTKAGAIEVPVYVLAGQAPGSIGLALGYGRKAAGLVGGNVGLRELPFYMAGYDTAEDVVPVGFDAYPLFAGANPQLVPVVEVAKGAMDHELVTTQNHHAIDEQGMEQMVERVPVLVREATQRQWAENPRFADQMVHHPPLESLWKSREYTGHAWGMAIDLSRCVGCNACVVACQSENNVPVVGKDQVAKGREMHWLRMDRYFTPNVRDEDAISRRRRHRPRRRRLRPLRRPGRDGPRRVGEPRGGQPAADVRPLRERPLRAGLPGRRDGPQRRGDQHDGLQPLHRHAVLLQQLPVQGPPVQLPELQQELRRREPGAVRAGAEPGGDRPQPRGDGEVHLLHAADPARQDRGPEREPADRGRRDPGRLRPGLPDGRDRVRRPARRRQRGGDAARERPGVQAAERAERPPPHRVPRPHPQRPPAAGKAGGVLPRARTARPPRRRPARGRARRRPRRPRTPATGTSTTTTARSGPRASRARACTATAMTTTTAAGTATTTPAPRGC